MPGGPVTALGDHAGRSVKLTILGGGGFRTPLIHDALVRDADRRITELALYDTDPIRLGVICRVVAQAGAGHADRPVVRTTTEAAEALDGADFVFSALRVGGLAGRTEDERVALDAGLLGQETVGAGGIAYGIRTVPEALRIAHLAVRHCPNAWVINFTNPAGLITQAMQGVLGERVIGICDSPVSLARHAVDALGLPADRVELDYVGLNHLGWLQGLRLDGQDVLPLLLADDAALAATEEGRLFGAEWVRTLGALPNEYLYYYYFAREATAAVRGSARTRGEFLLGQQNAFYDQAVATPGDALALWRRAHAERNATYLAELRQPDERRDGVDVASGGYEGVALALMRSLAGGAPSTLVLNVRGGGVLPGLAADAVIEVPCRVTSAGPRAQSVSALRGHALGLVHQVKAAEEAAIAAAVEGSPDRAVEAFAVHPLVDSVAVARRLVAAYRERIVEFDRVFS